MEHHGYSFQFYDGNGMVYDTDIICLDEAEMLFSESAVAFIKACKEGKNAEICLWGMSESGEYQSRIKSASSDDVIIKDGKAYTLEPIF